MSKPILFNGKGIEYYHILIVMAIIIGVFFVPYKTDNLDYKDFRWIFIDDAGKRVDNPNIEGGFGITTIPARLVVGSTLGTNLLAALPDDYNLYIEFPKSEITLTHKANCESDGVLIKANNKVYKLLNKGITITASSFVVEPLETPDCDWVWVQGHRKQSFYDALMEKYSTKVYMIPAEPFSVTTPAQVIVDKPSIISVPLVLFIVIISIALLEVFKPKAYINFKRKL